MAADSLYCLVLGCPGLNRIDLRTFLIHEQNLSACVLCFRVDFEAMDSFC